MIYIVGAVSVISLILNYLIYKRITATYPLGLLETVELDIVVERLQPEEMELESQEEAHDPPPVTIPMVKEVYQGWRNQTGIPAIPAVAPPAPITTQSPNRPPLARPDGFV